MTVVLFFVDTDNDKAGEKQRELKPSRLMSFQAWIIAGWINSISERYSPVTVPHVGAHEMPRRPQDWFESLISQADAHLNYSGV